MQVKEYLKNLNIHKSVGPDDMNPEVWRELANVALQISTQTEQPHNILSNRPPFRKYTGSKINTINIILDSPGINCYLGQVTISKASHMSLLYYYKKGEREEYHQERVKNKKALQDGFLLKIIEEICSLLYTEGGV